MSNDNSSNHRQHADASEVLARHLAGKTYADLPVAVVQSAKASILDTIGCVLAGTGTADALSIAALVKSWSGAPMCTLMGSGGDKLPPLSAVLANGAATHQYDFDDVHDQLTCHPTASTLIPALAAAEAKGTATGKDLVLAISLGNDITSRVSRAIVGAHGHPWYRAPVVGIFGATAAAAKMLGASQEQHLNAMGLALPQIGGTYASLHHSGSSVRSIRDGLAYRNGLLSAELAMHGIRGDPEVFEGKFGFYQAYYRGSYDRQRLLDRLGEDYETSRVSLKPWPSARHIHTAITALLDLMKAHDLDFDDVEEAICDVGDVNRERCAPLAAGVEDIQHIDLLANLPFALAAALLYRDVPLEVYIRHDRIREVIERAMPKVRWRYSEQQNGAWRFEPGRVELRMRSGSVVRGECRTALGHPDNPMSEAQRHSKFVSCAALAHRPVEEKRANRIVELVEDLDKCADIRHLMTLVS